MGTTRLGILVRLIGLPLALSLCACGAVEDEELFDEVGRTNQEASSGSGLSCYANPNNNFSTQCRELLKKCGPLQQFNLGTGYGDAKCVRSCVTTKCPNGDHKIGNVCQKASMIYSWFKNHPWIKNHPVYQKYLSDNQPANGCFKNCLNECATFVGVEYKSVKGYSSPAEIACRKFAAECAGKTFGKCVPYIPPTYFGPKSYCAKGGISQCTCERKTSPLLCATYCHKLPGCSGRSWTYPHLLKLPPCDELPGDPYAQTKVTLSGWLPTPGNLIPIWIGKTPLAYNLPQWHRDVFVASPAKTVAIKKLGTYSIDTSPKNEKVHLEQSGRGVAFLANDGALYFTHVDQNAQAYLSHWSFHTNIKNKVKVRFKVKYRSLLMPKNHTVEKIKIFSGLADKGWSLDHPNVTGKTVELPAKFPVIVKLKANDGSGQFYSVPWTAKDDRGLLEIPSSTVPVDIEVEVERDLSVKGFALKVYRVNLF